MTPIEAMAVVRDMAYKPGWKIQADVWPSPWGDLLRVTLRMTVPDAYDHDNMVEFNSAHVYHMLDILDEEGFVREVMRQIERAELHEAREFFTYKGERPFDPHRSVLEEGARYG